MRKLAGLRWDNKASSPPAGASFFDSDSGTSRPRTAPSLVSNALRKLSQDNTHQAGPSAPGAPTPLLALKLSTISFLDSVVSDGVSDNPLYVIETEENNTRIRRSDSKGFINVARVRWREEPNYFSRGKKDLSGVMLAFGKGQWKPADDFLGYSYSSIASSFLKFYLPHHPNSLRWKKVGNVWHCTTQTVKGLVAVLEPTSGLTGPELRIFHPVFDPHAPNTQRMHAGVPLSVLDFLLVTSMLLLTETDEWTNISRAPAPDVAPEPGPSRASSAAGGLDYLETSSIIPPVPPLPTPTRANTFHAFTVRNRSTASLASGPSGSGSGIVERWRANVAPQRPPTPDDANRSASPGTSQSQSKRASRSSAESEFVAPTSPLTHRFSMRSMASASGRPHNSHGGSSGLRDLPVPPVPQIPPLAYETGGSAGQSTRVNMLARSPSPATSQRSGSAHATPPPHAQQQQQQQQLLSSSSSSAAALGAWEPQASPISPAFAERTVSSRSYAPSSSGSSTPYPSTPSRALPVPPLPLPPVPTSQPMLDRQTSKSPGFMSVRPQPPTPLPSSPSPSTMSGMSSSRGGQDGELRRATLLKAPPGYATAHTDMPVPATPEIPVTAMEGMRILPSTDSAAPAASPRPETMYDAPPPAYSHEDYERRQAALNSFGNGS